MTRRKRLGVAIGLLLPVAGTTAAMAFFTALGAGAGAASVGTLQSPGPVTASTPSVGQAHITWTIVPSPSTLSSDVTSSVDRSGDARLTWSPASNTCTGALPRTTTACDDVTLLSGTYQYRVTTHFRSWTSNGTSNSVLALVDTTPPTSAVTFPASGGSYNASGYNAGCSTPSTGDICGTASDPGEITGGLSKLQVSIRRSSDSLYWNGATWAASIAWNDAAGTSSWSYAFAVSSLSNGVTYTVASRATDSANNTQTTPDSSSFIYDTTAPSASSINRTASDPTNASSVSWTVTFGENVSGVDSSDFALANAGLSGAPAISTVTGGPAIYTVTVSTGTGGGTLGLNLVDNDSIVDLAGNALGGPGTGNGNFTGQIYTIDRTAPTVTLTKVNGNAVTFPFTTKATVTSVGGACGFVSGDVTTVSWSVTGGATENGSMPCSSGSWTAPLTAALSASGTYTVSATQSDTAGNTGSSGGQSITIDQIAPRAMDIQASNGGPIAGQIDSGDVIVYTFSEAMDPSTILTSWNGSSISVTVSFNDVVSSDTMTVTGTNLGTVVLGGDYMRSTRTATANMVMSSSTITLTLTSSPTSGQVNTVSTGTMVWTPSTAAKDLAGNSMTIASATETGTPKKNF